MTADLRTMCGLGYPPSMYNQNANECANSVIKRDIKLEKLSVQDCVTHLQNIVQRQYDEARLAVLGRGEYSISEPYREYQVNEEKYYQMTKQQKIRHETRFFTGPVKNQQEKMLDYDQCNLSVSPESSHISTVSQTVVKDIFAKAGKLLQCEGNVVQAPGSDGKLFFVLNSYAKTTPHHVSIAGNKSQYVCDANCIKWVTHKICPHTVAVAEYQQQLQNFLNWFNNKSKQPKYTSLANFNMPASRGKKASKATSRRKGGDPNKQKDILEKYSKPSVDKNTQNIPALPNPSVGSYVVALLDYCNPLVTRCFGCQVLFRENNILPPSPRNLVVVSKMKRKYKGKDGIVKEGAPSNVYFHLIEKCIKSQNPYFIPSLIHCPEDLKTHLQLPHRQYLSAAGIQI